MSYKLLNLLIQRGTEENRMTLSLVLVIQRFVFVTASNCPMIHLGSLSVMVFNTKRVALNKKSLKC